MIRRMHVSEFVECISHAADTIAPNGNVVRCELAARFAARVDVFVLRWAVGATRRQQPRHSIRGGGVFFRSHPLGRSAAPSHGRSPVSLCATRYCITYARVLLLYTPNDRKVKQNIVVELMEEV